jgi:hypothetical protein
MMSNSFEAGPGRLLKAVSRECHIMAAEIAALGELLTSGGTGANSMIALQSFDYLAQQAGAYGTLMAVLAREGVSVGELMAAIDAIPLPAMRHRLHAALDRAPALDPESHSEAVFWLDP